MRALGPQLFFFLLVVAAVITLACGGSPAHIPQSVTVSPPTADAQTFPNGQVQFTATAYYNTMPSPVKPSPATWGACGPNENNSGVSISTTGLAQCVSGTSATYEIFAFVPDPDFHGVCAAESTPCGGSCGGVVGTAQLTCP
jgi:hypothetical protein